MEIPCRSIARIIEAHLKKEVSKLKKEGKTPHLIAILVGESPQQMSFVSIKKKTAQKLGIKFEFVHIKRTPSFEEFANILKQYSHDPKVTGILIQLPLPPMLQTESIYNYIPLLKEIEGHKPKSPFFPPIALACLTMIKYIYSGKIDNNLIVDMNKDRVLFRNALKHKKIVVVGRGLTGGLPIGKTLSELKLNHLNINSQTYSPEEYYREADIIITAAGKKVISASDIKPNVILLNVGMRKEGDKLVGDYDEKEIKKLASYYTQTPGGVGPIDVLYLFHNVIESAKLQR